MKQLKMDNTKSYEALKNMLADKNSQIKSNQLYYRAPKS